MLCRSLSGFILLVALAVLCILPSPGNARNASAVRDASWQKTFEFYNQVPCLSQEEIEYGAEVIAGLTYNSSRVFRRMCEMEGINFEKSKQAWSRLINLGLSYEQMLAFEKWSDEGHIHIDLAITALSDISSLGYEAGRSFRNYCSIPRVSPEHALNTIHLLNRLTDAQNRAVQNLWNLPAIKVEQAIDGLGFIARLPYYNALAAEALEKVPGINPKMVLDSLPLIHMLNMENAWNIRTLLYDESIAPENAWFWLVAFFANPLNVQEKQFHTLSLKEKKILLRSFYKGGEELIWKINNLHGVTDRFGFEISNHTLLNISAKRLKDRFEMLSPQVRSDYAERFYQAARNTTMVAILKQSIAAERAATAKRLTSANIYALLAQGSELYDSSFRNILVPVLKKNIDEYFAGNLLNFLQNTDPGNLLVSNFIVSLAQKGKLTTFFPDNSVEQEQILNLVARSAFKDEDAIILFSATFMHLLEVLEPAARSFLISRMSELADEGTTSYSRLITVILQYYLEEFPHLLSDSDRSQISGLILRHGAVDLLGYLATPFAEWKEDGTLSSLSIFHPDDDGMDSFRSNARILLNSGYELSLSEKFTVTPLTDQNKKKSLKLINAARSNPDKGLSGLFRGMHKQQFAVSFIRKLNGLTIDHAAHVYNDEKNQEKLLRNFVLSGTEMLAQRGHSYWRSEQITEPMEKLIKNGLLSNNDLRAKQRFLSLGSCGGVKAYTRLNELFLGNVDILATIGSGLAVINNPYNKIFFEIVAKGPSTITWKDMEQELAFIFEGGSGRDYLQPGSLPAILHKILDQQKSRAKEGSSRQNRISGIEDTKG